MIPEQPQLAAGASYWALLKEGPYSGNIVEHVAEAEGPVKTLPISGDEGEAFYEYQGTGEQGSHRYLHHYVCIAGAGPAIGSTRLA